MIMKKIAFALFVLAMCFTNLGVSFAQGDVPINEVKKYFLIGASDQNYEQALLKASKLSQQLDLKLELRGLIPHTEEGLTWSQEECIGNGWNAPCYVARGREADAQYVSIEWSNRYQGFSKGYYIVILASDTENSTDLKAFTTKVKKVAPDAYVKSTMVYMGCMH